MPDLDIWSFIAGLGIFLLGINQMEGGIKNLAGRSFRGFIRKHTNNPVKAIFVGLIITAIVQSSSVVSLMVLAFVGARIIPLRNAIAIILGTNIGTTVTGWIVASIGFKFPIDAFALPFLGIGGILVTFFSARPFFSEIGRLLVGFGALFLGLDFMKTAIDVATIETSFFEELDMCPQLFFPIGVLLTAVIQSSSATMAITLSALYAGVIPLEVAAAVVIGSDLGTTTTVVIGGLKGSHVKRQVAFGHVGFNVIAAVLALILLYPLIYFVQEVLMINEPLFQLVAFHSTFNILGVIVLLPFLPKFANYLKRLVKPKKKSLSPMILTVPPEVVEGAIEALRLEGKEMGTLVSTMQSAAFSSLETKSSMSVFSKRGTGTLDLYREIQLKEGELIDYYLKIQSNEMEEKDAQKLQQLVSAIKHLSLAAKSIKSVTHTIDSLSDADSEEEIALISMMRAQLREFETMLMETNDLSILENKMNQDYRKNVEFIYGLIGKKVLRKDELTSVLHLNSQVKQYKHYRIESNSAFNVEPEPNNK